MVRLGKLLLLSVFLCEIEVLLLTITEVSEKIRAAPLRRRSTIEINAKVSEAPRSRSSTPHPRTDSSKAQIAHR